MAYGMPSMISIYLPIYNNQHTYNTEEFYIHAMPRHIVKIRLLNKMQLIYKLFHSEMIPMIGLCKQFDLPRINLPYDHSIHQNLYK